MECITRRRGRAILIAHLTSLTPGPLVRAPPRPPPRSATPRPAPRAAASPRPAAHPSRARALCTQAAAKAACRDAALAMRAAAEQADRASVAYAHGISPQHRITASCPCTSPVAMLPPAHLPPISPPYIPYHRVTISHHIVTPPCHLTGCGDGRACRPVRRPYPRHHPLPICE